MEDRIPINYGEFHDFPRQIRLRYLGRWFYLSSAFDEERDDYRDLYEVYLLPHLTEEELEADPYYWTDLRNAVHLGQVPIAEVGLDKTRRSDISASFFDRWLRAHWDGADSQR